MKYTVVDLSTHEPGARFDGIFEVEEELYYTWVAKVLYVWITITQSGRIDALSMALYGEMHKNISHATYFWKNEDLSRKRREIFSRMHRSPNSVKSTSNMLMMKVYKAVCL